MCGKNFLSPCAGAYQVTAAGADWLAELGISCDALRSERRRFATQCLDFTERKHHLGGALGTALLSRFIQMEWIASSRVPRSARLTFNGKAELGKRLNLQFFDNQNVRYMIPWMRHRAKRTL